MSKDLSENTTQVSKIKPENRPYENVQMNQPAQTVSAAAISYGIKCQGEYTLADYYAFPDDRRVELIDGSIYDMAAPGLLHQRICGEIFRQVANYITDKKGTCIPFIAPVDVQLNCDDKTMVQPDIGILCDRSKYRENVIFGAPDFLIEVLSPSTRRKDMILKLQKYADAGVREYWMVDLKRKVVLTWFFEAEDYPVIYGFEDKIPVRTYNEEMIVDMSTMLFWLTE
ncbi:MAG: Uma2 family endonuclease [Lachnospiraceae bacterium]|nr:Uma2 family endonuclease [Lachnospiraceae bacterium]